MRKPGWYWVKHDGEWMVAYYGVLSWSWMYMREDGFEEMKLHEDKDVPFSEIGPRIPTPDEKPQSRPAAYAVFSENGNIQIWSADPIQAESLRKEYGDEVQELYVSDSPNP